jgi:hypothetical protein
VKVWLKRIGKWLLIWFFVSVFLITMGLGFVVHGPMLLAVGWLSFLMRVVPQVTFRWGAIAETVGVVAVLGVGLHLFLSRGWRQLRPEDPRPWEVRWTASLLGLLVLLFSATMATVGIGHQVGWMVSTKERLTYSTWRMHRERLDDGGKDVCMYAKDVLERDPSGASLSRVLLEDKEFRRAAESLHTVLTRGADGTQALVIFPRDPKQREADGVLRCAIQGKREFHQASALPRLLAGEAVAGGITD